MLDREPDHRDAAPVDDEPVLAAALRVDAPHEVVHLALARRLARRERGVVRAPQPQVVADDAPRRRRARARPRRSRARARVARGAPPPTRQNTSEHDRILGAAGVALGEARPRAGASARRGGVVEHGRLQHHARDARAAARERGARHAHGGRAVARRDERGEAEPEEHLALEAERERRVELVHARREHDVQARVELRLNRRAVRVRAVGPRDEDALERHELVGRGRVVEPVAAAAAAAAGVRFRHDGGNVSASGAVDDDEGFSASARAAPTPSARVTSGPPAKLGVGRRARAARAPGSAPSQSTKTKLHARRCAAAGAARACALRHLLLRPKVERAVDAPFAMKPPEA